MNTMRMTTLLKRGLLLCLIAVFAQEFCSQSAEAQWLFNPYRRAYRLQSRLDRTMARTSYYGYGGAYTSSYAPTAGCCTTSYYVPSCSCYSPCCSTCFGCSSCGSGCATGNCSNNLSPASGTTDATPTTFESSKPAVEEEKSSVPENTYTPKSEDVNEGGFLPPKTSNDAPMFETPAFNSTESLKPIQPVPKREPAPMDVDSTDIRYPTLRPIIQPVAVESKLNLDRNLARTRVTWKAQFQYPTVARHDSQSDANDLIPPLPLPVMVAGK